MDVWLGVLRLVFLLMLEWTRTACRFTSNVHTITHETNYIHTRFDLRSFSAFRYGTGFFLDERLAYAKRTAEVRWDD